MFDSLSSRVSGNETPRASTRLVGMLLQAKTYLFWTSDWKGLLGTQGVPTLEEKERKTDPDDSYN